MPAGITEHGFRFLLASLYSQLWSVVRQYLSLLNVAGGADLAVAINFLLRLGLQGAAAAMAHSQLGSEERTIAAHMCQLGLLMPEAGGDELWLHPTRLAGVLAGGSRGGDAAAAAEGGYVIVESNFRWAAGCEAVMAVRWGSEKRFPEAVARGFQCSFTLLA